MKSLRIAVPLLAVAALAAPRQCLAKTKCEAIQTPISTWRPTNKRYAYIVERTLADGGLRYFIVYSNSWHESDDAVTEAVNHALKKSRKSESAGSSDKILFSPENEIDYDYSPRHGRTPGMAGPGRIRFDDIWQALCNKK